MWEQELYNNFVYNSPRGYFHTFAGDVSHIFLYYHFFHCLPFLIQIIYRALLKDQIQFTVFFFFAEGEIMSYLLVKLTFHSLEIYFFCSLFL